MVYDEIAAKKERRKNDPEYRKREYQAHKKYIENNKDEINEYYRKYYEDNKDRMRKLCRERTRKYRENNKEKVSKSLKEYRSKPEYKEKSKIYRKERYLNNTDNEKQYQKDNSSNQRLEVVYHYSNGLMKCDICGESHYEFLEIDHIHSDGNTHRNEIGESGRQLILWILKNNFPYGFQVLCRNCNMEKVKLEAPGLKEGATSTQKYNYKYYYNRRIKVLNHYSNNNPKCKCCGESNIDKLCIDHINGGGNLHRLSIRSNLTQWLYDNGFPEGFRVLCENCNKSLGLFGYCPHKNERSGI
jgi:hypothetical protein